MGRILLCLLLALTAAQLRQREDASRRRPSNIVSLLRVLPPGNTVALAAGALTGSKGEVVTTVRASPKYCVNAAGLLTVVPANQPCVESTASGVGLKVEVPRTNSLLYSTDLTNAVWTQSGVSVVGGQPDPVGGNNAFLLTTTATGGNVFISQPVGVAASAIQTFTLWVSIPSGTRTVAMGIYDVTLGTFVTRQARTATTTPAPIVLNTLGATIGHTLAIYFYPASTTPATTGFVATVYAPQMEEGALNSSYIPTNGTAVARPSDIVSTGAVALSTTPSMAVTFRNALVGNVLPGPDQYLLSARSASGNFQMYFKGSDLKIHCDIPGGGAVESASPASYALHRVSCNYTGGALTICLDGTCTSATVSAPSVTSYSQVNWGNLNGATGNNIYGYLSAGCLDRRASRCL